MKLTVVCDCREHVDFEKIKDDIYTNYSQDISVEVNVQQLTVADFVIVDSLTNTCLALIEHKQVDDFKHSLQPEHMQPKRLIEQLDRMKNTSVPFLFLLLSGPYHLMPDYMQKTLITKSVSLQTSSVKVVHIPSTDYIGFFLSRVLRRIDPVDPPNYRPGPDFHELMVSVKKKKTDTPQKLYHVLLQLVPGVSVQIAEEISRIYPTFSILQSECQRIGINAFSIIKVKNRSINKSIGKLICDFCCEYPHSDSHSEEENFCKNPHIFHYNLDVNK